MCNALIRASCGLGSPLFLFVMNLYLSMGFLYDLLTSTWAIIYNQYPLYANVWHLDHLSKDSDYSTLKAFA